MALGQRLEIAVQDSGLETPGAASLTVPCKVAAVVWEDAQHRFQRFSNLVYFLAVLAVLAIALAVVCFLALDDKTGEGIVTLVGGLISGGLGAFIKGERDSARTDRDAAHKILNEQCNSQPADQILAEMTTP